jgi:uncharacterized protein
MAEQRHLLDVNVLVALAWPSHVHHDRAHAWFGAVRLRRFATCPLTESAFLRLSTNAQVVGRSVLFADAQEVLARVRALPGHAFVADDSTLADPVIDLARAVASHQVTDLHLVNLAAGAGLVLATLDEALPTYVVPGDSGHVFLLP